MNLRHKMFYAVAGFVIGNIILTTLISGSFFLNRIQPQTNEISYDQALIRIKNSTVRSVNVKSAAQSPGDKLMFHLFRLLFILFIISPPIIVVLLIIIIRKMDSKKSLE